MNRPDELLNQLKINRSGSTAMKKKRRWPWIIGALVVIVAAILLLRGGKALPAAAKPPATCTCRVDATDGLAAESGLLPPRASQTGPTFTISPTLCPAATSSSFGII